MEKNTKQVHKKSIKDPPDLRDNGRGGLLKTGGNHERTGRPRKLPALDEILAKVLSEEQKGMTAAEALIRSLHLQAIKGNTQAAKLLLERGYGIMKQTVDLSVSQTPDLSALTDEQLAQYAEVLEKIGTKNNE